MRRFIIDTFGADAGPLPIIKGAIAKLKELDDLSLVIVGDEALIKQEIELSGADADRIEIVHTQKFVTNNDPPTCVFRGTEDTSMVKALMRLKADDTVSGLISAGSTGALLVGSICHVGLFKGLMAPALASAVPCRQNGLVTLVDCGANVECSAQDLRRFALMGNAYMQCRTDTENPKVGIMSVGREDGKGTPLTKEAFKLLSELPIDFIGNLEGTDFVNGEADVVVTDGFTGNVLLKNAEQCGRFALEILDRNDDGSEAFAKLREELLEKFDFNSRGGAVFLGVKKTIVKMHGCAVENTVGACIDLALKLEQNNFAERVEKALQL